MREVEFELRQPGTKVWDWLLKISLIGTSWYWIIISFLHFLAPGQIIVVAVIGVESYGSQSVHLEWNSWIFLSQRDPIFFFPWILYVGLTFSLSTEIIWASEEVLSALCPLRNKTQFHNLSLHCHRFWEILCQQNPEIYTCSLLKLAHPQLFSPFRAQWETQKYILSACFIFLFTPQIGLTLTMGPESARYYGQYKIE